MKNESEEQHSAQHSEGEEASFDPAPHRPTRHGMRVTFILAVVCLVVVLGVGIVPRLVGRAAEAQDRADAENTLAHVAVAHVTPALNKGGVMLPGSVQPLQEAVVYARVNGYVRTYFVDIGDKVKTGQILAEIDTPDTDQELHQARALTEQAQAAVNQATTQRELARVTSNRYTTLAPSGVVSKQDLDERQASLQTRVADVEAANAALTAAQANLQRLQEIKSFATVRAPFDGIVTSRTMEKGQLVVAGTSNGQPLFKVDKTDIVRVFVNVPQLYAPAVRVEALAPTLIREFPGRTFAGHVTRTANALDPMTRTLLTEVRINNPDGALIAGMYAQVTVQVQRNDNLLLVPSAAVFTNGDGVRVALVEHGTIRWSPIAIDADLGDQVAVSSGVNLGDVVVRMPSARLTEGMKVASDEPPAPAK